MKWFRKILVLTLVLLSISGTIDAAGGQLSNKYGPILNNNRKWRIGFCESEPYVDYASNLYYLVKGMEEAGWISGIENLPFKEGQDDTLTMWNWLATHDVGKYVQFVRDARYDLKDMGDTNGISVITRLQRKKDIDLMIVTGTVAGIALAKSNHSVPTLIFSTSDPVGAGIIKSPDDSGRDNVWAHVDQGQFRRQIQVFHDIFKFKKLGLVFEDTELGRNYIAYNDIKTIAKEGGFKLVSYNVKEPTDISDKWRYYWDLRGAYYELVNQVDAMLLTVSPIESKMLSDLITPFYQHRIPVFSQAGAMEVQYGALMSITQNDYPNLQKFAAETIAKVFHGVKPRRLPQIFESTPRIILNLEVAKKIGYKPSFDILYVADEIYRNIKR